MVAGGSSAACSSKLLQSNEKWIIRPRMNRRVSRMGRFLDKIYDPGDKNLSVKIFLFFISLSIIGCVITTWYFYHQKVLEAFIDQRIRLLEEKRILKLVEDGTTRLEGHFGLGIPEHLMPYDCQHRNKDTHICLEWKYRAIVKVHTSFNSKEVHCFRVEWESLSESFLEDCFSLSSGSFYGLGESYPQLWPLNLWTKHKSPLVTGDPSTSSFGSCIERYWLTSSGAAILVDNEVPLYVSINEQNKNQLCLESKYDGYPYRKLNQTGMPYLKYDVCVGKSIKSVQDHVMKTHWAKKTQNINSDKFWEYFSNPVWSSYPYLAESLNGSTLLAFANSVMQSGFKPGVLVIDERWQEQIGSLDFHSENFASADDTLTTLRNKGFDVMLTISAYTSIHSPNFQTGLEERYFMFDSQQSMPLLTNWSGSPVAIVDFSSAQANSWMSVNLKSLTELYQIEGFNFVGGESMLLPNSYNAAKSAVNPDFYDSQYKAFIYEQNLPLSFISSFVFRSFVKTSSNHSNTGIVLLRNRKPGWSSSGGLRSIIPSVLTLGLLGNTIINIGPVGGDSAEVPDQELFIRWMQVAAFMPVFQFSVPPFDYDQQVVDIVNNLLEIRESTAIPNLKKALAEGSPLIKPLWWLSPSDHQTHDISDQFVLHDNVIVAPVVHEGATKRNIYLPEGWWKDEIRGTATRGNKWIYDYEVPIDKVSYFVSLEGAKILT